MIKAIDLFCGVGGITHGFIKAGIDVVAGVDIDKTCKFAYEYNNINSDGTHAVFLTSSVSEVSSEELDEYLVGAEIKIIAGCAPCQPFSRHQKDKNNRSDHEKWGLLYDFLHHINNIKPDVVSMENVPALIEEKVFYDFVETLENLNYKISFIITNSEEYGVPQRRRRLLLLASKLGEINFIKPTHADNSVTVRDIIGNLPSLVAGEQHEKDFLHRCANLSELNLKRIKQSVPGGSWKDWDVELLPECYKRITGSTYTSVYGRMEWDKVSPTLTTQFGMYGTGRFGHPVQNRALSIREGALIQTFPLDYKFINERKYSKTAVSRQIGNAVPVRLGEIIARSILEHIKGIKENNNE
ncbi:DNA (cytosine-5-)-methyltransferase [Candidatus Izimaplasma bacterium ZiA1]|nr:DNA (cytosine-5-)-methyltransferase [Candidatus Izimaplasma bacterium ZiA1]